MRGADPRPTPANELRNLRFESSIRYFGFGLGLHGPFRSPESRSFPDKAKPSVTPQNQCFSAQASLRALTNASPAQPGDTSFPNQSGDGTVCKNLIWTEVLRCLRSSSSGIAVASQLGYPAALGFISFIPPKFRQTRKGKILILLIPGQMPDGSPRRHFLSTGNILAPAHSGAGSPIAPAASMTGWSASPTR